VGSLHLDPCLLHGLEGDAVVNFERTEMQGAIKNLTFAVPRVVANRAALKTKDEVGRVIGAQCQSAPELFARQGLGPGLVLGIDLDKMFEAHGGILEGKLTKHTHAWYSGNGARWLSAF